MSLLSVMPALEEGETGNIRSHIRSCIQEMSKSRGGLSQAHSDVWIIFNSLLIGGSKDISKILTMKLTQVCVVWSFFKCRCSTMSNRKRLTLIMSCKMWCNIMCVSDWCQLKPVDFSLSKRPTSLASNTWSHEITRWSLCSVLTGNEGHIDSPTNKLHWLHTLPP